ncbi:MAG: ABC transporter substrate-binding protein [Bradyrhizobiaceae bacterium]|nr:ABC transporter substrate-binding protein [Bradyrhizobiaceae bacterium]
MKILSKNLTRRTALTALGAGVATLAAPPFLRAQSAKTIKIGYVAPITGELSQFGETDRYALERIRALLAKGLQIGGKTYNVEILDRDAQSNPNRAAELAGDLIQNKEVHIMVPASTTNVVNPVAEQSELFGVPCISSGAPWQANILPRGGADKAFAWTYHFFWGLEDIIATFVNIWRSVESNRKIGLLLPRNLDGEVWGNKEYGLPPALRAAGFEVIAPSLYQPRTNDFSAQIAEFRDKRCDIVGGLVYPADLRTFVVQCAQQNYKPPIMTIAAGLLFASNVEALGNLGIGMSTEAWWTPAFPFPSSLTGETSAKIAADWEAKTGKQWTQPLGYSHANWEVAIDTLKRSADPLNREAIRDSLKKIDLQTVVGKIKFSGSPHANVCKTPIVGGQWIRGAKYPFDLKIIESSLWPILKAEGKLEPLKWGA